MTYMYFQKVIDVYVLLSSNLGKFIGLSVIEFETWRNDVKIWNYDKNRHTGSIEQTKSILTN